LWWPIAWFYIKIWWQHNVTKPTSSEVRASAIFRFFLTYRCPGFRVAFFPINQFGISTMLGHIAGLVEIRLLTHRQVNPVAISAAFAFCARVLKITTDVEPMFRLFDLGWMFERASRSSITYQIDPVLTHTI